MEVGQHGDYSVVSDGGCLLLDGLWVFFTDWQLVFRASFQPHGHLGSQAADQEGELGLHGEVAPVYGEVGSMMWVCGRGVNDGDMLYLDTFCVSFTGQQPVFRASSQPNGHLGGQVADCVGEQGHQGGAVPGQGVEGDCGRVGVGELLAGARG